MIDREAFLKPRLGERTVDLPGVGECRVRGLSRAEAFEMKALADVEAMERKVIEFGLVDPKLSAEDIALWYANAPAGEPDLLINAIQELSGLYEGAAKSDLPAVRKRPRP